MTEALLVIIVLLMASTYPHYAVLILTVYVRPLLLIYDPPQTSDAVIVSVLLTSTVCVS